MSVDLYFNNNENNETKIVKILRFEYPYPELITYVLFATKRRYIKTKKKNPEMNPAIGTKLWLVLTITEFLDQIEQARYLSFMMPGFDTQTLTELKEKLNKQVYELLSFIEPIAEEYPNSFIDALWCSTLDISSLLEGWDFNTAILGKAFINKVVKLRRFVASTASVTHDPLVKFLTCDPMLYFLDQESERCFKSLENQ